MSRGSARIVVMKMLFADTMQYAIAPAGRKESEVTGPKPIETAAINRVTCA
jgi:hypothetical protein